MFSDGQEQINAQVLVCRAQIALGNAKKVAANLAGAEAPRLQAVKYYAEYVSGKKDAVNELLSLSQANQNDDSILFFVGLVLVKEGRLDEALETLSRHSGSLEIISLIAQIRLLQNKPDMAQSELKAAKKFSMDNIIYTISEAWVDFKVGGTSKYQDGLYIYEEIVGSSGSATQKALLGQLVAQLQMNRLPEANEILEQALEHEPATSELFINAITTSILNGDQEYEKYETKLKQIDPDHVYLKNLAEKESLFDEIEAKYAQGVN